MADPYEVVILDPSTVALVRGRGGLLQAVIGGEEYLHVGLLRTYPLSKPFHYLSVRNPKGEEIGILRDLAELDPDSRAAAEAELKFAYIVPVVTRIDRIKDEPGLWIWDLQTDRGPLRAVMRNLHEHMQSPGPGRLLITDMDGRRCEIASIEALDVHSRRELSKAM
jgi:hypothetical protein